MTRFNACNATGSLSFSSHAFRDCDHFPQTGDVIFFVSVPMRLGIVTKDSFSYMTFPRVSVPMRLGIVTYKGYDSLAVSKVSVPMRSGIVTDEGGCVYGNGIVSVPMHSGIVTCVLVNQALDSRFSSHAFRDCDPLICSNTEIACCFSSHAFRDCDDDPGVVDPFVIFVSVPMRSGIVTYVRECSFRSLSVSVPMRSGIVTTDSERTAKRLDGFSSHAFRDCDGNCRSLNRSRSRFSSHAFRDCDSDMPQVRTTSKCFSSHAFRDCDSN